MTFSLLHLVQQRPSFNGNALCPPFQNILPFLSLCGSISTPHKLHSFILLPYCFLMCLTQLLLLISPRVEAIKAQAISFLAYTGNRLACLITSCILLSVTPFFIQSVPLLVYLLEILYSFLHTLFRRVYLFLYTVLFLRYSVGAFVHKKFAIYCGYLSKLFLCTSLYLLVKKGERGVGAGSIGYHRLTLPLHLARPVQLDYTMYLQAFSL